MGRKNAKRVPEIDERTKNVFLHKGYRVETLLGAGSFGEVYRGVSTKTDVPCAVKIMNLDIMSERFKRRFLPRELGALMELRHVHIIRTWDIMRSNKRIYIFMEFASNGDVARYLKQHGTLTESRASIWFGQVASALQYLHDKKFFAHRDMKIDNILLNEDWLAKITDFGFVTDANVDADGNVILSKTFCGTLPYYPPELLRKEPYNAFKADVWSTGVVLYAMTHNKFPFHFRDTKLMQKEQSDDEYKTSRLNPLLSEDLKELILLMFHPDQDERPTFKKILKNPWVMKYKEE